MPSGKSIYDDSGKNQRRPEPQRQPVGLLWRSALHDLEPFEEEAEACHHKTEPHKSQSRANPCQKRTLNGQIVAEAGLLSGLYWRGHMLSLVLITTDEAAQKPSHSGRDARPGVLRGNVLSNYSYLAPVRFVAPVGCLGLFRGLVHRNPLVGEIILTDAISSKEDKQ